MSSRNKIPAKITGDEIKQAFRDHLRSGLGRLERFATKSDFYLALALTVRDRVFERTVETMDTYGGVNARRVAYLLAEYLPGPHLANNLLNLGITEVTREALHERGYDLEEIIAQEEKPGLGNGGLGWLASCFMDSLASVEVPAIGYGIRYKFGIFDQVTRDGWQCEIRINGCEEVIHGKLRVKKRRAFSLRISPARSCMTTTWSACLLSRTCSSPRTRLSSREKRFLKSRP